MLATILLLGFIILVIGLVMAAFVYYQQKRDEKYSDPMSKTMSGYTHSRFEDNALNKRFYSKVSRSKRKSKKFTMTNVRFNV